jgi:ferredoxin
LDPIGSIAVCHMCYARARDVFDMERVVSARVQVFGRACFNVSKI